MPVARTPASQQPGTRHSVTEMWLPFVQVGRMHYSDGSTHILVKGCCPVQDGVTDVHLTVLRNDLAGSIDRQSIIDFELAVELEDKAVLETLPRGLPPRPETPGPHQARPARHRLPPRPHRLPRRHELGATEDAMPPNWLPRTLFVDLGAGTQDVAIASRDCGSGATSATAQKRPEQHSSLRNSDIRSCASPGPTSPSAGTATRWPPSTGP